MLSAVTLARTGSAPGLGACIPAQPPCRKPPRRSSSGRPGACMTPSRVRFMNTTTLLTGASLSSAPAPCLLVTLYTNRFGRIDMGLGSATTEKALVHPHGGKRSLGMTRVAGSAAWVDPALVGFPGGRVVLPGSATADSPAG